MSRGASISCLLLLSSAGLHSQSAAPLRGETYRLAEEAYRRQKAGDLPGAIQAVEAALVRSPGHDQLVGLKLDLLFAAGRLDEADAMSREALSRQPNHPRLRMFRVYLQQRQGHLVEALQDAAFLAGHADTPGSFQRQARLAMADLNQALAKPGLALAALEPLTGEHSYEVQSRLGFLRLAAGQPGLACEAFQEALLVSPEPTHRRVLLHGLCDAGRAAQQPETELKALEDLHDLDPQDHPAALALAYAYLARKRDADALPLFSNALDSQSQPGAWLDAGYAAKRLGRNQDAATFFSKGIDARSAAGLREPQLDYGLRREVEGLNRTWGVVAGTAYRQGGLLPGLVSQEKIIQQGLETFWQPQGLAREGRMVQVFAQVFENLYTASGGTTGGPTIQGVIGVRAKPFITQNLVFTAQKLVKVGRDSMDDWMFRAAYSNSLGLDLRPWEQDWSYWSVYTEGATFASTGQYIHQLEARLGHTWRLSSSGGRDVWAPHVVLSGDFDNRQERQTAGGLGLGASLRHWFREDRHQAPASWIELTLQTRARLTSASRGGGLFLTLTCWY